MTDDSGDVSRRAFLLATSGATAAGAAGVAVGQEENGTETATPAAAAGGGNASAGEGAQNESGGEDPTGEEGDGEEGGDGGGGGAQGEPDYGGFLDDVDNYDSTVDERGSDEVTITVGAEGNGGAFAFEPAAVWIDPGTTVVWEWTGEGGGHNVNAQEGADFTSETTAEGGHTFEQTIEEGGIITYQCDPHVDLGMKGALAVGDDVPTTGGDDGGGGAGQSVGDSAKTLGIASTIALTSTLGLAYVFLKYGGSYEVEEE